MSLPRFGAHGAFFVEVRARVGEYLARPGVRRRDLPAMYLKTAVILAWLIGSWALLVFVASTAWQGVLLAISAGLAIGGLGMSIMHDGNHGAYSARPWVNRLMGLTLDGMGVCSYIWRHRHNRVHHTFTNIDGVDEDFDFGTIARLSAAQPLRPWHRFQHVYLWGVYMFVLPTWAFFDDVKTLATGKRGVHPIAPFGWKHTLLFFGMKAFFLAWSVVIPLFFHPWYVVLLFHVIAVFTLGVTLGSIFQLAHVIEDADNVDRDEVATDWAVHQLRTTVDFAHGNRLLTWYCGGLNYQIEHHLFPTVCHLHYPAISRIVQEVAHEHGVRYRYNETYLGAMASHYRHVRRLGCPQPRAAVTAEVVSHG